MRRFLLLVCLFSCICLWMQGKTLLEEKDSRDKEKEKRSVSHDRIRIIISDNMLTLHLVASLGDVCIQLVDDNNGIIYQESLSVISSHTCYIPLVNPTGDIRLIIAGSGFDMDFPIVY